MIFDDNIWRGLEKQYLRDLVLLSTIRFFLRRTQNNAEGGVWVGQQYLRELV